MVGLATDRSKPVTNISTCEFKQVTLQRSAPELIAQYVWSVMDHAAKQLNTEYLQVLIDHKCDFSHYDFSHVFFSAPLTVYASQFDFMLPIVLSSPEWRIPINNFLKHNS